MSLLQIKAILCELSLSIDGDYTYDKCVQRLVYSQWMPSRDAIQIYQRQRATPVRTVMQKQEDRVRLCTLQTVSKLSCAEMKLWLQRNGGRVPDGSSDADKKNMERAIRNQMRVITPVVKRKRAPKRPKKAKSAGHIQRAHCEEKKSRVRTPPPDQDSNNRVMEPSSPPTSEVRIAQAALGSPIRSGRRTPSQPMSSSKKRRLRMKRGRQFFDNDDTKETDQQETVPKQPTKEEKVEERINISDNTPSTPPQYRRSTSSFLDTQSPETPLSPNMFGTPGHSGKSRSRLDNMEIKQTLLFDFESPARTNQRIHLHSFGNQLLGAAAKEDLKSEVGDGGAFLAALMWAD